MTSDVGVSVDSMSLADFSLSDALGEDTSAIDPLLSNEEIVTKSPVILKSDIAKSSLPSPSHTDLVLQLEQVKKDNARLQLEISSLKTIYCPVSVPDNFSKSHELILQYKDVVVEFFF